LGCTAVFQIRCRPTFQRCVLPPSSGQWVSYIWTTWTGRMVSALAGHGNHLSTPLKYVEPPHQGSKVFHLFFSRQLIPPVTPRSHTGIIPAPTEAQILSYLTLITLMMEAACASETSVDIKFRTQQYIPEDSELLTLLLFHWPKYFCGKEKQFKFCFSWLYCTCLRIPSFLPHSSSAA
jgi:hypothetical protein